VTKRIPGRVSTLIVGLVLLAPCMASVRGAVQRNAAWITTDEQIRLAERVRKTLPSDWTVTPGELGRVPDGWHSLDARSFAVEGRRGDRVFRTWFLPRDWIGIRQPGPGPARTVYWEGVLMDQQYKSITVADQVEVHQAVRAMGMQTPSLINSGWASGIALFTDRLADVDERAQELVRRFCSTRACGDEAARSLIVLGVPAKTLTLDCAEHSAGQAQEFCASALGYWGGPESVRVLSAVVSSPGTSSRARRSSAFSLGRIGDTSAGPALRQALQATSTADRETAGMIADAIGRMRYQPAAPDILARLAMESDGDQHHFYLRALGNLKYRPAVPAIEKLSETTNVSAEWIVRRGNDSWLPEWALLRIRETWGEPAQGIRLLLLAPESPSVSGRIQVAALVENVGDTDLVVRGTSGVWIIDGKEYPNLEPVKLDGNMTLAVDGVDVRSVDLSRVLSTRGTHSVRYRLVGATSNHLTLQLR
jgi:hypothetical protein